MSNAQVHSNLFELANYKFDPENQAEPKNFLGTFGLGQRLGCTYFTRIKEISPMEYNPILCSSGYEFLDEKYKQQKFVSKLQKVFDGDFKEFDHFTGKPLYVDLKKNPLQKNILFNQIEKEIKEAQAFLQNSANLEHIPFEKMDFIFSQVSYLNRYFAIDHKKSPPRIILSQSLLDNTYLYLEDQIGIKFYLEPYLNGESDLWLRARVCQECGKLFPYKQKRARFCSSQCGMKEANRKRRSK